MLTRDTGLIGGIPVPKGYVVDSWGGGKGVFIPDFYGAWVFCFHGTRLPERGV